MTFIPDMMKLESGHIAMGWLHPDHPFAMGEVPEEFVVRVREFAKRWSDSIDAFGWGAAGGMHQCEFCGKNVASGSFGVPSNGRIFYVPEMISHYVEVHAYAPPKEFVTAVLKCPLPGTTDYETIARTYVNRSVMSENEASMSTIMIEVTDRLREFAESEASQRGCADVGTFIRLLLEDAAELAAIRQKLQEAEDEIARGEYEIWHPGDCSKRVRELIKQRQGADPK